MNACPMQQALGVSCQSALQSVSGQTAKKEWRHANRIAMTTNRCPFCDHENPIDAKFCGGCGVLNLLPCPNCGAVNENSATTCYRCHTKLEPAVADAPPVPRDKAPEPVLAGGEPSLVESAPSRRQPLVVIGVVLIAVAAASYFFYRQTAETPSSVTADTAVPSITAPVTEPVAKAGVGGGTKPEASPVLPTPAPVKEYGDASQAKPAVAVKAESGAAAPAAAPAPVQAAPEPVQAVPAPAAEAAMTRQSEPPEPGSRPSRFSAPGGMGAGRSKPPPECTAAIAALGLCTLQ